MVMCSIQSTADWWWMNSRCSAPFSCWLLVTSDSNILLLCYGAWHVLSYTCNYQLWYVLSSVIGIADVPQLPILCPLKQHSNFCNLSCSRTALLSCCGCGKLDRLWLYGERRVYFLFVIVVIHFFYIRLGGHQVKEARSTRGHQVKEASCCLWSTLVESSNCAPVL